jgi:hypothetical protein
LELFFDGLYAIDMGTNTEGRHSADASFLLNLRFAWLDKPDAVIDPSVLGVEFEVPKSASFAIFKLHRLIESQKLAIENCWSIRPTKQNEHDGFRIND